MDHFIVYSIPKVLEALSWSVSGFPELKQSYNEHNESRDTFQDIKEQRRKLINNYYVFISTINYKVLLSESESQSVLTKT